MLHIQRNPFPLSITASLSLSLFLKPHPHPLPPIHLSIFFLHIYRNGSHLNQVDVQISSQNLKNWKLHYLNLFQIIQRPLMKRKKRRNRRRRKRTQMILMRKGSLNQMSQLLPKNNVINQIHPFMYVMSYIIAHIYAYTYVSMT